MRRWVGGLLRRWADRIDPTVRFARGGVILSPHAVEIGDDHVYFLASPGRQVTDPDEAEALGLTVDARRMRAPGHGQKLNAAGVAAIPVVSSSTPPPAPPPPSGARR